MAKQSLKEMLQRQSRCSLAFRPDENYKRFNNSARMAMPEVPEDVFKD
jgi:branched-subunit amino acid aminotransferase/4-amino-4-deoxychorismate lyase